MTAEIKVLNFAEGLPVTPPDENTPLSALLQKIRSVEQTDSTTTGSDQTSITNTASIMRFTDSGLVSLVGIAGMSGGQWIIISNETGVNITLKHNTGGTASNRFILPNSVDMVLKNGERVLGYYSPANSRLIILGGAGGGGYKTLNTIQNVTSGGKITVVQSGDQVCRVQGNAGPVVADSVPLSANILNGATITITGQSDTNYVDLVYNDAVDGFLLKGNIRLKKGTSVTLYRDSDAERYYEISRTTF